MKIITIASVIIFIATIAYGEHVYLECKRLFDDGLGKDIYASMNIDESNAKVTHTDWNGDTYLIKAFFSADEVKYDILDENELCTNIDTWIINRNDLSFTHTFMMKCGLQKPTISIRNGKCEIIDVKDRKF
jgi:hypothetical protein